MDLHNKSANSPNLESGGNFTSRDLLLKKLQNPVICSVISQFFILQVYLFVSNFNILHPIQWVTSTLTTMTFFTTWLFLALFLAVVFLQALVCAKDYVLCSTYCSTRFQKLISVFSIHNCLLLSLHILIGGSLVWLFLSLSGGTYSELIIQHKTNVYSLNEPKFFLILGGFWTGLYYFVEIYVTGKHLVFPVIQQKKILQFKAKLFPLIQESVCQSVWPTVYFSVMYYFLGSSVASKFSRLLHLLNESSKFELHSYFMLLVFATLYCLSMNLMRFFFNLFITEAMEFPLFKTTECVLTLQEALVTNNLPIVQNLACLDLYRLSQWSPTRRQALFTLSQPGGHPHNWNCLITNVLKLFTEYTNLLNKSTESIITTDKNLLSMNTTLAGQCLMNNPYQSPDYKFRNFRNMSLYSPEVTNVDITYNTPPNVLPSGFVKKVIEKFHGIVSILKVILGINYLFGELPQVNIQKCLANGYLIVWTCQGISELTVASLSEDKYGIVQKDLPVLLTTLVHLKLSLEKLNKVPALSKRFIGNDDFNIKMKSAVLQSVKRSLYNICRHFGEYMTDFPLSKEVLQQLQPYFVIRALE